jgi:hypothetical protein
MDSPTGAIRQGLRSRTDRDCDAEHAGEMPPMSMTGTPVTDRAILRGYGFWLLLATGIAIAVIAVLLAL